MSTKKMSKSKLPPVSELTTTKNAKHSGRSANFFPILLAADKETQFSAQWTLVLDQTILEALEYFKSILPREAQSNLNESTLVRYAVALLTWAAGCNKHPIPAMMEMAIKDLGDQDIFLEQLPGYDLLKEENVHDQGSEAA